MTQTHTIDGVTIHIIPAPSFGRRDATRPTRWIYDIPGQTVDDDPRPRRTPEDALNDALAWIGAAPVTIPLCRCGRPATMTASLGPACDDHYDDISG